MPALARVDGVLGKLEPDAAMLLPPDTERMARQVMPESRIKEFED